MPNKSIMRSKFIESCQRIRSLFDKRHSSNAAVNQLKFLEVESFSGNVSWCANYFVDRLLV